MQQKEMQHHNSLNSNASVPDVARPSNFKKMNVNIDQRELPEYFNNMQGETVVGAPLLGLDGTPGNPTTVGSATLKKGKIGDASHNYHAENCSKHKNVHRNHSGRTALGKSANNNGGGNSAGAAGSHTW